MAEAEHRPLVEVETVRPFTELFEALEQAGFETARRPPLEQRYADVVELFAIYLAEKVTDPVVARLAATVRAWATTWLRSFLHEHDQPASISIPIYGPHGEVLSRVELDED